MKMLFTSPFPHAPAFTMAPPLNRVRSPCCSSRAVVGLSRNRCTAATMSTTLQTNTTSKLKMVQGKFPLQQGFDGSVVLRLGPGMMKVHAC